MYIYVSRFEPDPRLRAREVLSYEGFASYLMDSENDAVQFNKGKFYQVDLFQDKIAIRLLFIREGRDF